MKLFLTVCFVSVLASVVGCGGTASNSNVGDSADQQAMQDYEAQQKANEAAENAAQGKGN